MEIQTRVDVKMRAVYSIADNIISPLGSTTRENFESLKNNLSGIQKHDNTAISAHPFHASLFSKNNIDQELFPVAGGDFSVFERVLIHSIKDALSKTTIEAASPKVVFIISSTKGNISMIEHDNAESRNSENISLYHSAKVVATYFNNTNQPLVVSNACISGVLGILTAKRLIEAGVYETAVVAGADLITKFILSGFQSFQAVSPEPCKPFDVTRQGVTLGEGAATMVISADMYAGTTPVQVMGGSTSNDANHISGPSRDGAPLYAAIQRSLQEAGISGNEIGFISAHGTATIYNDEMEAKAISLSSMDSIPVNSMKGYYGHTLGAAGLIESVITMESLKENFVLPTKGFQNLGVSKQINVSGDALQKTMRYALKTASGFGGCNAAMVFGKSS